MVRHRLNRSFQFVPKTLGNMQKRRARRLVGSETTTGTPRSPPSRISVKIGTSPRNGILNRSTFLPVAVAEDFNAVAVLISINFLAGDRDLLSN